MAGKEGYENKGGNEPVSKKSGSVDVRRRRLTQGLAGGIPVVMTLAQRPVWANANCSPSAVASANSSLNPDWATCALGCSPDFWRGDGQVHRVGDLGWVNAWNETGVTPESSFAEVFRLHEMLEGDQLAAWMAVTLADALSGRLDFIDVHVDVLPILQECVFQATAAYLNTSHPVIASGYSVNGSMVTRDLIVDEFQRAYGEYLASVGAGGGGSSELLGSGDDGVITGQSRISDGDSLTTFSTELADTTAMQVLSEALYEANNQACVLDARNYDPSTFA